MVLSTFEARVEQQVKSGINQMQMLVGDSPDVEFSYNKDGHVVTTITSDKSIFGASSAADKLQKLSLTKAKKLTPLSMSAAEHAACRAEYDMAEKTKGEYISQEDWDVLQLASTSLESRDYIQKKVERKKDTQKGPILLNMLVASYHGLATVGGSVVAGVIGGLSDLLSQMPLIGGNCKFLLGTLALALETLSHTFGTILHATFLIFWQMILSIFFPFMLMHMGATSLVGVSSLL